MPDAAFEAFWELPGAPGLVAFHSLFTGMSAEVEAARQVLGVTHEQFRVALTSARELGFLEFDEQSITFFLLPPDSTQRARLDWCLGPHREELAGVVNGLKAQLLIRFLDTPPAA